MGLPTYRKFYLSKAALCLLAFIACQNMYRTMRSHMTPHALGPADIGRQVFAHTGGQVMQHEAIPVPGAAIRGCTAQSPFVVLKLRSVWVPTSWTGPAQYADGHGAEGIAVWNGAGNRVAHGQIIAWNPTSGCGSKFH